MTPNPTVVNDPKQSNAGTFNNTVTLSLLLMIPKTGTPLLLLMPPRLSLFYVLAAVVFAT